MDIFHHVSLYPSITEAARDEKSFHSIIVIFDIEFLKARFDSIFNAYSETSLIGFLFPKGWILFLQI